LCHSCLKGKQHRLPFPKSTSNRATERLALIHSDVCGPINPPTHSNTLYFLTFIDDKSRYTILYLLKHKSKVFDKFQIYKQQVENETAKKILILRSDIGGEYRSNKFDLFCQQHGIKRQYSAPNSP
jgi:transposase InsO family protein